MTNKVAGLVFACIAPHGLEVIPELAGEGESASRAAATRAAMQELERRVLAARPDTVVVLTPHGVRVAGAVCVMATDRAFGILEAAQWQDVMKDQPGEKQDRSDARVDIDMPVDAELGHRIAEHASRAYGVPTVTAIYGASSGDHCYTPLDWGAVVPLWFLGARWPAPPGQPLALSITPSRALTLRQLYDFGTALVEAAVEMGRRIALVASADWGHAHAADGPYGFDSASAEFDAMLLDTVRADALDRLLEVDLDFADRAKVDGLWQAVMLAGALRHTPMRGELLSYEVPTYYGMLVAAYEPPPAGP